MRWTYVFYRGLRGFLDDLRGLVCFARKDEKQQTAKFAKNIREDREEKRSVLL